VFAPAPLVTVTIERDRSGLDDVHFHVGGQGFWIGRLLAELGLDVVLCGSFGGEPGRIAYDLLDDAQLMVRAVWVSATNGAYVHDRRSGERREVASTPPGPLSRHEVDDLYEAVLVEGLDADVCVLAGTAAGPPAVPADVYRRLAEDLTANGAIVIADLSGEALDAVLQGRVAVLKISDRELLPDREDPDVDALVQKMRELGACGATHVVVTRAESPALALIDGRVFVVRPPRFTPLDHRGAGDSMTAGVAAELARGADLCRALRVGAAAGAVNVTRRGLASGRRDDIERLAKRVEIVALAP
jgi:1-phosphofructokinase